MRRKCRELPSVRSLRIKRCRRETNDLIGRPEPHSHPITYRPAATVFFFFEKFVFTETVHDEEQRKRRVLLETRKLLYLQAR